MVAAVCTPDEFVALYATHGTAAGVARVLGCLDRAVHARRERLREAGYDLPMGEQPGPGMGHAAYTQRIYETVTDGCVVVASDRHWWPGDGITHAEAALLTLLPRLDPDLLIFNGDLFDGAGISRHAPMGWERRPSVDDELAACQAGMGRIAAAAPRARKVRTVGNHDRRFDYRLAQVASEFRKIDGFRLSDHLGAWREAWSCWINTDVAGGHTVVKHKHHGGMLAGRNNTIKAGVHTVTGHTHNLSVTAIEDYRGRRWGVECGFLSTRDHPAFEYTEDGPSYARSGFVVLTYRGGVLLPPETVEVDDAGVAWFRSEPVALRVRVKAGRAAA